MAETNHASQAAGSTNALAAHFERRPEFLFFHPKAFLVTDATSVRERALDDLKVFRIADVFAGPDEIFVGFGKPNAYLVVPDGKGGYQKFAGKSLKRDVSVIADTRGWVQSGILIRLTGLPVHAAEKIRAAMQVHHGHKYWTCVNACLRVLEDAGFTYRGKKLSSTYFPYALMKSLLDGGLEFEGNTVTFEVIRTTPHRLEHYARQIIGAELSTFGRHFNRTLEAKSKTSKLARGLKSIVDAPGGLVQRLVGKSEEKRKKVVVAPALPPGEYANDIRVRVTIASWLGSLIRQVWGPHALFEAQQDRVSAADFFQGHLEPFPQAKPSLATRIKKRLLFSRPVIWLIRQVLAPRFSDSAVFSERDVYDMLRTHTDETPNVYNLVIAGSLTDWRIPTRVTIARTTVGAKLVDWVLSKHVLMSGYDRLIVFAGEVWKDAEGVIHVSGNSGTYRPTEAELDFAVAFLQLVFPHLRVVKEPIVVG